jgi:hypothetical protein
MCHYFSDDVNSLLHHLVRKHQNVAAFIAHCNDAGCGATYANVRSAAAEKAITVLEVKHNP